TAAPDELIAIHDALDALAEDDPQAAELVKLRYFAGFAIEQAAELLGVSRSTAYEHWAFAKAWLKCQMQGHDD
ncbi:MAG: RNA polymerase subunit sigma, partial [Planctomycetaceae bacterium]|nr:RNA polymerase subunit sigma [Planctomycetaceae bacterium]